MQAEFLLHHSASEVVQNQLNFEYFRRNYSEFQICIKKVGGAWCHHYGADVVQAFQNDDLIQNTDKLGNCMNNQNVLTCNHHCEVCDPNSITNTSFNLTREVKAN